MSTFLTTNQSSTISHVDRVAYLIFEFAIIPMFTTKKREKLPKIIRIIAQEPELSWRFYASLVKDCSAWDIPLFIAVIGSDGKESLLIILMLMRGECVKMRMFVK